MLEHQETVRGKVLDGIWMIGGRTLMMRNEIARLTIDRKRLLEKDNLQ